MNDNELKRLPEILTASDLQAVLRISRANTYNLMNSKDFPTLKIGNRKMVQKSKLLEWMERNTNGSKTFAL